jgi:hypothetical protein
MKSKDSKELFVIRRNTHIWQRLSEVNKVKLTKKYRIKFTKEISKEKVK